MTDQDTSLPAQLRRARERQGLSLDQAHQSTGISLKVLRGLESDSAELVELIYMRLAMISYAEYLGLDVAEITRVCDAETGFHAGTHTQPSPPASFSVSGSGPVKSNLLTDISGLLRSVSSPLLIGIGVTLLLVLVLIAAWLDLDLSLGDSEAPPVGSAGAPADSASATREIEVAAIRPVVVRTTLGDRGFVADEDVGRMQSLRSESVAADSVADTLASAIETPEVVGLWGPSSVPPPPGLVLEAVAVDTTWVQVLWDGRDGVETTMVTGERRQWAARDSFFVRSGIAHGVQFSLQGQLLGEGRLGDPDEVLRFRASRDGVVLLGRDLRPVGKPIPLADGDSTDGQ